MIFRTKSKDYQSETAVEIVNQMARDTVEFSAVTVNIFQEYLKWSLQKMSDSVPPRELDLSERVSDELQAQSYLSLRHDYGIGELVK